MKTSKILKAETFVSLTKYEMVKILGGESCSNSENQNTSTNNSDTSSMQQENQKFSTLSNIMKTK
ncbi:hypothetical protein CYCD_05200 [Tenuifilaceae bacterium CYCD]|nr:hypothetical protein CYCD_05200 [Tenuifilaceae bacterium CYCD]